MLFGSIASWCTFLSVSCNKLVTCNANGIDLQCISIRFDVSKIKVNSPIVWELITLATDSRMCSLPTGHPVQDEQ